MAISIYPITENFAAEVGVDFARPIAEDVAAIKDAFWKYAVLIFPDQNLTEEQHVAFAKNIGPIEPTIGAYRPDAKLRLRPDCRYLEPDPSGQIWAENSKVRGLNLGTAVAHG